MVGASDLHDEVVDVDVNVLSPDSVEVRLVVTFYYVFAKAIRGTSNVTTVEATATASAIGG